MRANFDQLLKFITVAAMAKLGINFEPVVDKIPSWYGDGVTFIMEAVNNKKIRIKKGTAKQLVALSTSLASCAKGDAESYEDIAGHVTEIANWIEWNRKEQNWIQLSGVSREKTNFLDGLRKIILIDSESSERILKSKIGELGEPLLVKCFAGDITVPYAKPENFPSVFRKKTDQQIWDKICDLARDLGTPEDKLPAIENQKKVKETDPETLEIWLAGRNYLQKKAKHTLTALVRNYGVIDVANVPLLPIKEAHRRLKELGIIWPMLSRKLKHGELISDSGTVYTKTGLSLGRSVPADAEVIYNPNFEEVYVNKFVSARKTMSYMSVKPGFAKGFTPVYPVGRANANKDVSQTKVSEFAKDLDSYRLKWTKDLDSTDDLLRMQATAVELVYQNCMRIGSKLGSTIVDGVATDTFGLTFFQRKHVKIVGNGTRVIIEYPGKAAQIQTQTIKAKSNPKYQLAINNFISYIRGKKANDYIFTYESKGKEIRLTAALVNTYLKSIVPITGITIHKFRHAKANYVAAPILANCPLIGKKNTFEQVKKWFIENMKPVGEALGHFKDGETTGTTAIKSYIDPKMSKKFFEDCNVQVTPEIEKQLSN